jgi:hypothetical protein
MNVLEPTQRERTPHAVPESAGLSGADKALGHAVAAGMAVETSDPIPGTMKTAGSWLIIGTVPRVSCPTLPARLCWALDRRRLKRDIPKRVACVLTNASVRDIWQSLALAYPMNGMRDPLGSSLERGPDRGPPCIARAPVVGHAATPAWTSVPRAAA